MTWSNKYIIKKDFIIRFYEKNMDRKFCETFKIIQLIEI